MRNKIGSILFSAAFVTGVVFAVFSLITRTSVLATILSPEFLNQIPFPVPQEVIPVLSLVTGSLSVILILNLVVNFILGCVVIYFMIRGKDIAVVISQLYGMITLSWLILFFILVISLVVASGSAFNLVFRDLFDMFFTPVSISVSVVYIVSSFLISISAEPKNKNAVMWCGILGGMFGIHLFYTGKKLRGLLQVLLTMMIVTIPVSLVILVIDLIRIGRGSFKDSKRQILG